MLATKSIVAFFTEGRYPIQPWISVYGLQFHTVKEGKNNAMLEVAQSSNEVTRFGSSCSHNLFLSDGFRLGVSGANSFEYLQSRNLRYDAQALGVCRCDVTLGIDLWNRMVILYMQRVNTWPFLTPKLVRKGC